MRTRPLLHPKTMFPDESKIMSLTYWMPVVFASALSIRGEGRRVRRMSMVIQRIRDLTCKDTSSACVSRDDAGRSINPPDLNSVAIGDEKVSACIKQQRTRSVE